MFYLILLPVGTGSQTSKSVEEISSPTVITIVYSLLYTDIKNYTILISSHESLESTYQIATGSPILSFGPIPLLRTAKIPIISPRPAIPVEHHRPVEYCWARLCPFSISTASVVAAEMANATPEPIWNDVLSCSGLCKYLMIRRR